MNPAPSMPKYASHRGQWLPRSSLPDRSSGPTTNSVTKVAEMAISVISALRPLPKSMLRPNAVSNWSLILVVWKKKGRLSVVGATS